MGKKRRIENREIIRYILLALIILFFALTFTSFMRYLVLFAFISVNLGFALAKRFIPKVISKYLLGIELIMFCTVLTSIAFGSVLGSVMGALLMLINYVGEKRFSQYFIVTVPLYMIIGYAAYFFRSFDIVFLGIIITIIYNLLVYLLASFFEPNRKTLIIFNLVNIVFNAVLFISFGGFILNMLH